MPIIQFSEADFLAGKILEKGPYKAEVIQIGAAEASKSQKSITFPSRFRITQEPAVGKELEIFFNTETSANSMLGIRQYMPHLEILKLAAAVEGVEYEKVPKSFDTDTLKGRAVTLMVDVITSQGNIMNQIIGFFPANYDGKVPF